MKRPMLYWVCLLVLGELMGKCLPVSMIVFCVLAVAGLWSAIFVVLQKKGRIEKKITNCTVYYLGIVFFLLGVLRMYHAELTLEHLDFGNEAEIQFSGYVVEKQITDTGRSYILYADTVRLQDKEIHPATKIKLILKQDEELSLGVHLKGVGKTSDFRYATNPGAYDERENMLGKGIILQLTDVELPEEIWEKDTLWEKLYQVRCKFKEVYYSCFDEKKASLATAMVLGDKASLDKDMKELYQRNGIAHLIAISGLHIAMIGGTLYQFIRKTTGKYSLAACVGAIFIILYGMMTGLSGATFRAIVMLIIAMGADLTGRKCDIMTSIAGTLFFMLMLQPYQMMQVGFLLSFGAVLGIGMIYPIWKQLWNTMPGFLEGFFVSLSVQLMVMPVELYFFYEIPLYGVFLNILVVPLMSILLPLLILCGISGCIVPFLGRFFAVLASLIFGFYEQLCSGSEQLPFHTVCIGRPGVLWIVVYYALLGSFLILCKIEVPKKTSLKRWLNCKWLLLGAIGLLMFCNILLPADLKICMFDVGQGDGMYIRTPKRHHIVMDGGSSTKANVGKYVIKNGVKYYGAGSLDYVIVTHSDSDHYSGIKELLSDGSIKISNLILPGIRNPDAAYRELVDLAKKQGCTVHTFCRGDTLLIDGVTFLCLNPQEQAYEDKNTGSLVFLVSYGAFDVLLSGDMDTKVEQDIVSNVTMVEVLKVAHHGSDTASSKEMIDKLQPQIALLSVGERNRYGHPSANVMERLLQYTDKIYLTKDHGAITIDTDGTVYTVRTFLHE